MNIFLFFKNNCSLFFFSNHYGLSDIISEDRLGDIPIRKTRVLEGQFRKKVFSAPISTMLLFEAILKYGGK